MKRFLTLTTLAILGLPLVAETLNLAETTNGKTVRTQSVLTRTQQDGLNWELSTAKDGASRVATTATGELRAVEITAKGGKFALTSDGSTLKVTGTWEGKPLTGTLDVKGKVWALNFESPLKWYARQGFTGSMPFLMVNPGDLAHPTAMVLTKEAAETLGGKNLVRLKVGLEGPLSLFWSAKIWSDPATGILARYQGTKGPGTPESTIELESVTP